MANFRARAFTILWLLFLIFPNSDSHPNLDSLHLSLHALRPSPATQISAAEGVLSRILPNHTSSFDLRIISQEECDGKACFIISNAEVKGDTTSHEIQVSGSSGVEILSGLHWYLKYWCGGHISWRKTGGMQLGSVPKPGELPRVDPSGVKVHRVVPWSYYQNVVTVSYSSVWWDWKRWKEEIDWMALQGINLPLAFTGQEAIWQKVFKRFNLTDADLGEFFGGPAFLAWARMGNLHGWGGPLTQEWLDSQLDLQREILSYMHQLGMTPVLPAFSGNVPSSLKRIFPSANISQLGNWNTVSGDERWCCTYLLDPNDELFVEIGKMFIEQQIEEFGDITHIYNCDTFNENEPPTSDPSYIASLGTAVYKAMQAGDHQAVWLMQGWLFSSDSSFWQPPQMQALLHAVPLGKLIILDLFADVKPIWKNSNNFYGVPFIWCMLHNFGGNIEMYGILDTIASEPVEARITPNSSMVGMGMCMEGIEQNPVVYELMAEMAFQSEKIAVEEWIKMYSSRRYGGPNVRAIRAWQRLHKTIYNCQDKIANHNTDIIVKFPDLNASEIVITSVPGHQWYSNEDAIVALDDLLQASKSLENLPTYRYDVADLTRQVLAKISNHLYNKILSAYQNADDKTLKKESSVLLELVADLDNLLASNECFLLGTWLESAKALAVSDELRAKNEWNARTQITMWFDNTEKLPSQLHDYANKYWSGLIRDYYLPRMALYFDLLEDSLTPNVSFPFVEWRKRWISLTNTWQTSTNQYSTTAIGDTIWIANSLLQKYRKMSDVKTQSDYIQNSSFAASIPEETTKEPSV
ncbi:hypothetical protein KP509_08G024500 [Ceratopteris richardii]|uniref:Alpha-N-acetylglucosaminidase n=1 Tax=Ceratopteris richardii TaxID=49495 RepID=A0A8T2U4B3_CERRI|nr:hypothetical protein KP509_08G024500 [Ceratopteris richardii]